MKFYLFVVVSLLLFSALSFSQNSGKTIEQAQQLLRGYEPPKPTQSAPSITPQEAWLQEYREQINAITIRWVDSVIAFSSEYGTGSWSANQVIGLTNVYPGYGDYSAAWASANSDGQREFLELHFADAAPASRVAVYETYNPGAIDTVYVRNPNSGDWEIVWQGTATSAGYTSRIFSAYFPLTSFSVSDVRLAINSPAVSGFNEIDAVALSDEEPPPPPPFMANTLPSYTASTQYANAVAGEAIEVWGNVQGGTVPYTYKLDYGDGSIETGSVSDPHFIGSEHTYVTAGTKMMKLTVYDAAGDSVKGESVIRVFAIATNQVRINMAIEKGLLYLYKNQYPEGYWYDGYGNTAATGGACLAFEENGHLPTNDYDSDIYAQSVRKGMDHLLTYAVTYDISDTNYHYHGDPDSDGDGLGAYLNSENYANGIGLLSILGGYRTSEDADADLITTGPYIGQSHYNFIVDALDQLAYSQTDSISGDMRGGWQYNINTYNYGASDNSAVQWPGLVFEAAEKSWGMAVHPFVKDELHKWLTYSQDTTGGFGYSGVSYWNNIAKTGAGIGSYAVLDYDASDPEIIKAIEYIDTHWNDTYDSYSYLEHLSGNLYAMYAVAKGLRTTNSRMGVTNVGSHNWYQEYSDFLLNNASYGQQIDGSWYDGTWISYQHLSTAFAILILTQGVVIPPPVAVIAPISSVPTNTSFKMDGSESYHQDPSKSILEWLWDFDASDGLNWNQPDARGQKPTNPGYADSGRYQITLRVKDTSNPPMYDTDNIIVAVNDTSNHPPVAVAIPPGNPSYAAKVGEPILLDGSYSYDPDAGDSVVAYSWDTDGNGVYGDAITKTVTVTFTDEYQGQVGLRVYDTKGDSSSNLAYITIVASRKDVFVKKLEITSSSVPPGEEGKFPILPVVPGDSLHVKVVLENDNESNTDVLNVLVRLFDADPLTIGNRLGSDYYVDLPIGTTDSIETWIKIPVLFPLGEIHLYVYLDPTAQVNEWNENNNLIYVAINVVVSDIRPEGVEELPTTFKLSGNYPNPFNPETKIRFEIPVKSAISVQVFNILGQRVSDLNLGVKEIGYHELTWRGNNFASGIYIYVLKAEPLVSGWQPYVGIRKMVLVK
jgi:hypothetical protein